eukprot:3941237-Rhodomonas_salina.3
MVLRIWYAMPGTDLGSACCTTFPSCYALATQCPVLTYSLPMVRLRSRYAMSGTEYGMVLPGQRRSP